VTTVQGQGHVTYQQQKRYNSATGGHINFKLGGKYERAGATCNTFYFRLSVGQTDLK